MPLRRCNAAVRPAATARSARRPHPPSALREWLRSAIRSDPVICRRTSRSRRRGCADTAPSCSLRHPPRRSSGRDCRTRAPSPGRSGRLDARRSHAGMCPPPLATRLIPPALPCRERCNREACCVQSKASSNRVRLRNTAGTAACDRIGQPAASHRGARSSERAPCGFWKWDSCVSRIAMQARLERFVLAPCLGT